MLLEGWERRRVGEWRWMEERRQMGFVGEFGVWGGLMVVESVGVRSEVDCVVVELELELELGVRLEVVGQLELDLGVVDIDLVVLDGGSDYDLDAGLAVDRYELDHRDPDDLGSRLEVGPEPGLVDKAVKPQRHQEGEGEEGKSLDRKQRLRLLGLDRIERDYHRTSPIGLMGVVLDFGRLLVLVDSDQCCLGSALCLDVGIDVENREEEGKVVLGLMGIDCYFEEEGNWGLVIGVA